MKALKFTSLALASLLLTLTSAFAEMKNVGPYQVHFSAFESTFLTPQVAKQYQLTRSRYQAVLNVSVLDTRKGNIPTQLKIKGEAKNLLGHNLPLNFKEIKEEKAVYYIEQLKYSNEETFRFFLELETPEGTFPVQFMKKFYVN